jgi:hypothetical protein
MNRCLSLLLAASAILAVAPVRAAAVPSTMQCADQAVAQARRLLNFHVGNDERAEVPGPARPLPSIANPANAKQRFDVLEVMGYVYKGEYRMRLLYYRMREGDCVLMGQEILEHASL